MLYYLFHYLDQLDFPGAGMFKYISFRSGMALIFSLFISTIIGKKIIDKLQYMQIGEIVRDLGLEGQMSKKGTPTMGGIIIIIAIIIPCLLFGRLENIYMLLMLITTVWLGAIGFLDDYIKVFKKDKEGLHGRFKIIGQVGLGLIVGLTLYLSPDVVIRENVYAKNTNNEEVIKYMPENIKSTQTTIPFLKNNNFDYADLVPFLGENVHISNYFHCNSSLQRSKSYRWTRRISYRKLCHNRSYTWHFGLPLRTYCLCVILEYYVYSRDRGACRIRKRFYRSDNRVPMVQCIPSTSVHG